MHELEFGGKGTDKEQTALKRIASTLVQVTKKCAVQWRIRKASNLGLAGFRRCAAGQNYVTVYVCCTVLPSAPLRVCISSVLSHWHVCSSLLCAILYAVCVHGSRGRTMMQGTATIVKCTMLLRVRV
ncbi:unnamed protein product [Discosporangium mesarthrocarpum]